MNPHENGFSRSSGGKEQYGNMSSIERYISEDDPWKKFLVIGKEKNQDARESIDHDVLEHKDKSVKVAEDSDKSTYNTEQLILAEGPGY